MWLLTVFVLVMAAGALVRALHGRKRDGFYQTPRLCERMEPVFRPYEGRQPSPAELAELSREAGRLFSDIITGLGLMPGRWSLQIHVDDILGPLPQVHGPSGQVLGLAAFERGLTDGSIDLPSA
jgi:hypothetical protein